MVRHTTEKKKTPKKPKKKSVPAKEPIVPEKENEEKTV